MSGAEWKKIDFHSHSPASFDFQFGGLDKKEAYQKWVEDYNNSEIDAVVLTDHNTFSGYFEIQEMVNRAEVHPQFKLIPGAELTVSGDYHVLVIFDAETFTPSKAERFLGKIGYEGKSGESQVPCKESINEVAAAIKSQGGLTVPAHANNEKGLFNTALTNNDILGSGLVHAIEVTDKDAYSKLVDRDFKDFQISGLVGSDSHQYSGSQSWNTLGRKFTWVKAETANYTGLVAAFQDGKSSIRPYYLGNPVKNKGGIIRKIIINNRAYTQEYNLNKDLNSLIGGRGAGKSTLIEIIRLALGKYPGEKGFEFANEWFSPHNKSDNKFWNANTKIEIYYDKEHGDSYKICWSGSNPTESTFYSLDNQEVIEQSGNVRKRFPIEIYSQKQIYEISENPSSILEIIDSYNISQSQNVEEEIEGLQVRLKKALAKIEDQEKISKQIEDVQGGIEEYQNILNQISKDFPAEKVENLRNVEEAIQRSENFENTTQSMLEGLKSLIDDFAPVLEYPTENIFFINNCQRVWQLENEFRNEISKLNNTLVDKISELESKLTDWQEVRKNEDPRNKILGNYGYVPDFSLGEFDSAKQAEIQTKLNQSRIALNDLNSSAETSSDLNPNLESIRSEMDAARKKKFGFRLESSRKLQRSTSINIEMRFCGSIDETPEVMRSIFAQPQSYDQFFSLENAIFLPLTDETERNIIKRINMVKENLINLIDGVGDFSVHRKLMSNINKLDKQHLKEKIIKWYPEDSIKVSFSPDGGSIPIDISSGSPGQRTAALLTLILKQNNYPLILDQPEDDLDNSLITDLLVKTARAVKEKRQLIVATHNANFVINANSENILALKYGYDGNLPLIDADGFIQNAEIRQSVCTIMEGGEYALRKRYEKLLN